ncbi:DUF4301 family protein [bacterium]|jgi:hypothetical protein|nr:DUF4301 family protein [bacterium]MBT3794892.1 DUF4301 family protein [bacterium]MBT4634793.1 DUF4301 family protein [bacterium]
MLNQNDLVFLSSLGISKEEAHNQVNFLEGKTEPKNLTLIRPCIHNDGVLPPEEVKRINLESGPPMPGILISRFVPSSGSATRMFSFDGIDGDFFNKINLLPFYSGIQRYCSENQIDLEKILKDKDLEELKNLLLNENLMNLKSQPKALIDFHLIENVPISPLEQFVVNSFEDISNSKIFFTIQDGFREEFSLKITNSYFLQDYEQESICDFIVQSKSTNSICLDSEGELLRAANGDIYTHPAGHGSLLGCLNEIDADFIFINNIDNISPKTIQLRHEISKSLFNIAMSTKKNFDMMIQTFSEKNYSLLEPSIAQLENILPSQLKERTIEEKVDIIIQMLNKPIRVCGVVKDEDSKGGKPFWVYDGNSESVQIVEESQVDFDDLNQKKVWDSCSYFNPVEMICSIKDYSGNKFNLKDFSEDSLKMNVKRNIMGKDCRFVERPGLWNGSMHYWHTTFVEIPSSAFTPVKNFTDLFLSIHQP